MRNSLAHLRTLFGPLHLAALAGVLAAALLWPAGSAGDRALLRWLILRTELFGPLVLMGLTASVLLVDGRVDERWGTSPRGMQGLFLQRWSLATAYYALATGLFIWGAGPRAGGFSEGRVFLSALVTAALFSAACHFIHHLSGSAATGWAGGLAAYFITVTIASFWCPYDSAYQLWLPFAGVSDASPGALALSKTAYALLAVLLLRGSARLLAVPERLIRANG